jgi:protein-tyrosine phosphatase
VAAQILLVCTGNLCRSPMAEHLLRVSLDARDVDGIIVRSAGTLGYAGDLMHRNTLAVLADRGIDGSAFRVTHLDEAAVADVDVVIGMAREHRAAAVTLRPALLNRAFTLAELSRICADIDPAEVDGAGPAERLLPLARLAASRRTNTLPADPADDDLPDPIGQPKQEYVVCADTIESLLSPIVGLLQAP